MKLKFISLGHRCHISSILSLNKLRNEAYPFDNIIYSIEGIIDCFKNNFINFFPKNIICEYVFVGTDHPESDSNGNRKLFRGKYGSFTHHDLNNDMVIESFKNRINRLKEYLSNTNDEVIFLRTAMDDEEINLLNELINTIQIIYPELKFKIFLIYDNKNIPEIILKYNDYAYIVNSIMITLDQNSNTNSNSYNYLFKYFKNINNLDDIKINDEFVNSNLIFKNDDYKGYAILDGIFPYDKNN
uniref:Papain-like cysteine peptidase n=1 Tax=viral metagenome TaxID=1070528 RepID=A0A6C0EEU5_9ZZZZ